MFLFRTYTYNRLMCIRISRRSYRTYGYNRLMFIRDSRRSLKNLYLYYGVYTCLEVPVGSTEITERIIVLRNLYLRYKANSCISDTEVPVGTIEHFAGTKVPVGTTEQIHYTDVPVSTTGLILILVFRILYLFYRYGSTCRYY